MPYKATVNPTALFITIAYGVVTILAVAFILFVWRSTHRSDRAQGDDTDTQRLEHGEKKWFVVAIALLGVLLVATLPFIPYGDTAAADGQQTVDVEGRQFAWIVNPTEVRAGVPTRFTVTASDVNHGFAVYNDDNVMLFQIQAVPDHPSNIVYTFKEPGVYQIVCIEFCGLDHHNMLGRFTVGEAQ